MKRFGFVLTLILIVTPSFAQWTKTVDEIFYPFNNGYQYGGALVHKDGITWGGHTKLYSSADSGKTWTQNSLKLQSFIMSIDFLDRNNGIVTDMYGGAQITTDGGKSWTLQGTSGECLGGAFGSTPNTIVLALRTTSSPYLGIISVSNDGGNSWRDLKVENGGGAYHVVRGDNGRIYVLARTFNNGPRKSIIYSSDDNGVTWNKGSYSIDMDCYSLAVSPCNDDVIFVVDEDYNDSPDNKSQIYRSNDGGKTYSTVFTEAAAYLTGYAVSSKNALYAQTATSSVMRSTDNGASWKLIGGPNNFHDSRVLCPIDDNILLAADHDGNLWRTTNSGGDSVRAVPGKVTLRFSAPASVIDPLAGAQIMVPISLNNAAGPIGFDAVLHYGRGFDYLGTFAKNGDRIDQPNLSWTGRALVRFRSSDIVAGTGMIGYSIFKVKWFEPYCDLVHIDSATSDGGCLPITVDWKPAETIVGNYPGCASSVEGETSTAELSIRPNPSHGVFTLTSTGDLRNTTVIILDALGKVVYEANGDILQETSNTIDLSHEPAGIYYVRVQRGSSVTTMQVVKQ